MSHRHIVKRDQERKKEKEKDSRYPRDGLFFRYIYIAGGLIIRTTNTEFTSRM